MRPRPRHQLDSLLVRGGRLQQPGQDGVLDEICADHNNYNYYDNHHNYYQYFYYNDYYYNRHLGKEASVSANICVFFIKFSGILHFHHGLGKIAIIDSLG